MNDQQLEKKVREDGMKIRKDLNTLLTHRAAQFSRFESQVGKATGKAKDGLTKWVEDGASQLSDGFEKLSGDARGSVEDAATTVKKEVGHGLKQFNARAQKIVNPHPDNIAKRVAKYPLVIVTVGLMVGFLLGFLAKPGRQPLEQFGAQNI